MLPGVVACLEAETWMVETAAGWTCGGVRFVDCETLLPSFWAASFYYS